MEGPTKTYEHPRLILCEGPEDVSFLNCLITDRRLPRFHISHTGDDRHLPGGNSKFGTKLSSLRLNKSFRAVVDRVLIVTDSDDDPAASFRAVRDQINAAGYPTPTAVETVAAGDPSVAVITIPRNGPGNLECFLSEAARIPDPTVTAFVDHFVDYVATSADWTSSRKGKLWLRALISARWPRDPCINISPLFRDNTAKRIIPVEHQHFNELAAFLSNFAA